MISRRTFLGSVSAVCAVGATEASALSRIVHGSRANDTANDPASLVDIKIGTGGHGHTFPGATLPFGAVQLSPDTYNDEWDWCSGYHISDTSIMGFSHTHLSGTGCGDLLDFLVMPGTGESKIVPGPRSNPDAGYRSRFSHDDEHAEPGFYSVLLKDYGIRAELTATERAGLHRYSFATGQDAPKTGHIIVDLEHSYAYNGKSAVVTASLQQLAPDTLAGGRTTKAWGDGRQIYFTMKFSQQPSRIVFYQEGVEVPAGTQPLTGKSLKCVLFFDLAHNPVILVKTGISGVSAESAGNNLKVEIPAWDFEGVRRSAREKWNQQLSRISITTENETHRKIFYAALYHASVGPSLFDDVDGRYRGMDKQIHQLDKGQRNYTAFSLWDTYRAAHPMYTLMSAERVPDFANTLIRMAEQSPDGMPVWPLQGCETGTMTGYHSAAVIAEACNKGVAGVDYERAYKVMMKRAMVDDIRGLGYYRSLGYIPSDKEEESVSKTFEYCYDDWSIAHVAKKLGHADDAKMLVARSRNYRNYYDRSINFARPKLANGEWATPFNPIDLGVSKNWRDFTESNSWQATFAIQHDAAGLIEILGGQKDFLIKLDELFNQPSTLPANAPPDIAGLVGQYAHGNEPSHHIAYLYVYAGQPHKTQARVRMLMETMYAALPDGLQGNEDVGQMSAWYIMSSMGFYSVDPVSGNYIFGTPLFDRVSLQLGRGRQLEIVAHRKSASDQYIQSVSFNGKPYTRSWFNHRDIVNGARIVFEMGPKPNLEFGSKPEDMPPSLVLEGA
ncbi:GH92 family glycosyl hydrolase [Granulicella sp. L60]|uniref:GH92 family glycosyl hydrolase n=1 Tax=Granulicella sp. L60 TaxID=1641866 RepID=UPI00131D7F51|nr:GH92 family glycosyl hydrolase [Granulicella sp. L60]